VWVSVWVGVVCAAFPCTLCRRQPSAVADTATGVSHRPQHWCRCPCCCCPLPLSLLPLLLPAQSFHDRLKAESDILETYDVEESVKYITVRMWGGSGGGTWQAGCCERLAGVTGWQAGRRWAAGSWA
jgi:hypothetical protein